MNFSRRRNRSGFSLIELSIVIGAFGSFLAGTWLLVGQQRQVMKVNQTIQAVVSTADNVRSAFGGLQGIGGFLGPVPGPPTSIVTSQYGGLKYTFAFLQPFHVFPADFEIQSVCNGVAGTGAKHPLSQSSGTGCGTFSVCDFDYTNVNNSALLQTACSQSTLPNASANVQYFAIELTQLDAKACVALATGVTSSMLPGLQDTFINAVSATRTGGAGYPVLAASASANCNAAIKTNVIDFIYTLRPPAT